ncbi:glutamine synthetase [Oceanotoga teriensis]|uniref:Glutamine synthetase n=1 Tax=Oceanotoga teriensis TaxID=515440 RepID=A0AA45C5V7_9BACT|nr:glutamine synthetase beta-grasp domain-containing protein [Oceanotoga teriensis]PWJ90063.1 glutamine synthetase [Oceanotoga teriensis]
MELKKIDFENFDIEELDFLDLMMIDIEGNIRHVSIAKGFINEKLFEEGIGFDASNLGFAKVTKSDMVAIPDKNMSFLEYKDEFSILHMFCDVVDPFDNSNVFAQYPRNIIKLTHKYLLENNIAENVKMLVELEFHVFDDVSYSSNFSHSYYQVMSSEGIGEYYDNQPRMRNNRGYHNIYPTEKYFTFRNQVVNVMESIGIPVKYHHHEVGTAQLEIELNFIGIDKVADYVTLSRWIIKNIAEENNLFVTFMPKPIYNMPGNGMHVHQFLEKDNKTLFVGDKEHGLSELALNYLSGILDHSLTGSLLAFTNPSTNSFKRLVPGFEAPISATFAKGSRSAAIRIPGYLKEDNVRIEFRTGDATANLYYSLSAMVLAGIDGILNKSNPIEKGYSSIDHLEDKQFPLSLDKVLLGLKNDNEYLLRVFPKDLIELWINNKSKEASYVYNAPTPQEYELYF